MESAIDVPAPHPSSAGAPPPRRAAPSSPPSVASTGSFHSTQTAEHDVAAATADPPVATASSTPSSPATAFSPTFSRRSTFSPGHATGGIAVTPALQVRASLISRILGGFEELGGNRQFLLVFKGLLALVQLVAFVTILVLTRGQHCDQPMQAYIIVHTVRVVIAWPGSVYTALAPQRPSRHDVHPEETMRTREERRPFGSKRWDARIRWIMDILALVAFVAFVLGNYFFFSSQTCRITSPELYWTTLAVLVFGWLYATEIIFIVLAVTFFLPIVLLGMRFFGWGQKKPEVGPCTKDQIDKIPLVLFVPAPDDADEAGPSAHEGGEGLQMIEVQHPPTTPVTPMDHGECKTPTSPATNVSLLSTRPRRRKRLLRLLFGVRPRRRSHRSSDELQPSPPVDTTCASTYIPTPYPLHPLPPNSSTCAICLSDYEPPPLRDSGVDGSTFEWELLRRLEDCGHCFHKDCLDEWLGTSGRCPLCQLAVVHNGSGKKKQGTITVSTNQNQTEAV